MQTKFIKAGNNLYIVETIYKGMVMRSVGMHTKEDLMESFKLVEEQFNAMIV